VATDGDSRGGRNSGECNARVGQQATLGAPRGPMDGARVIAVGLMLGGGGVHGGRHGNGGAARHDVHKGRRRI
jgi:hypothetical protein